MTPIISPWVFYIMPVVEGFSFLSIMASVFGIIVTSIILINLYDEKTSCLKNEDVIKLLERLKKKAVTLTIVFMILAVFIPREHTITKMIIAKNVTYERVEVVGDTVETVYNDIMELFDKSGDSNG